MFPKTSFALVVFSALGAHAAHIGKRGSCPTATSYIHCVQPSTQTQMWGATPTKVIVWYPIQTVWQTTTHNGNNEYTSTIHDENAPTCTAVVGKPEGGSDYTHTVWQTKTLPWGSQGYTSTHYGSGSSPTCTIEIASPQSAQPTQTVTEISTLPYGQQPWTSTYSGSGASPTCTVIYGSPKPQQATQTIFVTSTLAYGSAPWTSTIPGSGSSPTCTVVYGKPQAHPSTKTVISTSTLEYGQQPYTSTIYGTAASPTCTVVHGWTPPQTTCTKTTQLWEGSGYTSIENASGATPTVWVGVAPVTVLSTKTLGNGQQGYTSTIAASPSKPTCTVIIAVSVDVQASSKGGSY